MYMHQKGDNSPFGHPRKEDHKLDVVDSLDAFSEMNSQNTFQFKKNQIIPYGRQQSSRSDKAAKKILVQDSKAPTIKYSRTCVDVLDSEQSSKPFEPTHQESEEYSSLEDELSSARMKPAKRRPNKIHSSIDSSFALDTTEEESKDKRKSTMIRKKEKIEAEKKEKQFQRSLSRKGSLFTKEPFTFMTEAHSGSKRKLMKDRCMSSMTSSGRIKWDLFIMVLAVLTCFLIPFQIAFQTPNSNDLWLLALNSTIDVIFFVDIIFNFRTSYISSKTGKQVTNPKQIFCTYCLGRFWLDLLATIPFDQLYTLFSGGQNAELFSIFGLLKVFRVLRLSSIINNLNLKEQHKMTLKIVKLCFFLVLYVHIVACCWYYLVRQTEAWVPPLDFMWYAIYEEYGGLSLFEGIDELYSASIFHKYWVSVYHSVMMLTGGEVGPRTTLQTCFAALVILFGSIINANIFGHMAVLITSLEKNSSLFQERIDSMNTSMKNMRLSRKIQRKVQNYLLYTQSNHHHKEQLRSFLVNLSPTLQNQVLHFLFEDILRQNPVLKQESKQFHSTLVKKLELNFCQPDDQLIEQGEPEKESVYFLVRGECTVSVKDYKGGLSKFVRILRPGCMFGEVALLCNCKRTASVKSINYSIIARLPHNEFEFFCQEFPEVVDKLKREIFYYNDPWRNFIKSVLRGVSYFRSLSHVILNDMHTMLGDQFVKEGLTVLKQQSPCQSIVFLTEGEIELCVRNTTTGKMEVFDTLRYGAHIGQFWVLSGQNYNFSARAKTDVTIHFLPCEVLLSLRSEYPELDLQMKNAQDELRQCNRYGGVSCDIAHRVTKKTKLDPLAKFRRTVERMVLLARIRKQQEDSKFLKLIGLMQETHEENDRLKVEEKNRKIETHQNEVVQQQFMRRNSSIPIPRFSVLHPPPPMPTVIPPVVPVSASNLEIKEELQRQREELREIKTLLFDIIEGQTIGSQIQKKSKFYDPKRTDNGPVRRLSGFSKINSNQIESEESLSRRAQLKSMRMFKNQEHDTPLSTVRLDEFSGTHNSFTNQMASKLSLTSLARANNRMMNSMNYPGLSSSRMAQKTHSDHSPIKTSKFIQEMEELVGSNQRLNLRSEGESEFKHNLFRESKNQMSRNGTSEHLNPVTRFPKH